jgi:hypothetical protein
MLILIFFCKDEVAQRNVNIFCLIFGWGIFLHLRQNRQFQDMVCCRYNQVFKVVCYKCLGLLDSLSFDVDCLAFFGYFSKNLAFFYRSSGHPAPSTQTCCFVLISLLPPQLFPSSSIHLCFCSKICCLSKSFVCG